jgi:hypothetical protein
MPVIFVWVFLGVPTKSAMSFVKHDVAQLSMAISNESESYLVVLAALEAAVKQQYALLVLVVCLFCGALVVRNPGIMGVRVVVGRFMTTNRNLVLFLVS